MENVQINPNVYQVSPVLPSPKFGGKFLPFFAVTALVVVSGTVAYFLGKGSLQKTPAQPATQKQVSQPTQTPEATTPLFSGRLNRLEQDLKLFKAGDNPNITSYYSAGIFMRGDLKDYTRIVALRSPDGPGPAYAFVLATKDFQTFTLNDPDHKTTKFPEDNWNNPYAVLDKTKVLSVKDFETELPNRDWYLGNNFGLFYEEIPTDFIYSEKPEDQRIILLTDFSNYQKLKSPNPSNNLTVYYKPYPTTPANLEQMSPADKVDALERAKYLKSSTEVVATDSTGLPQAYSLTTPTNIGEFNTKLEQASLNDYVPLPTMKIISSEIKSEVATKFFKTYQVAIPGACAFKLNTNIINVADDELEQIGTAQDLPLFRLKNKTHPLYTLAYNNKTSFYEKGGFTWSDINKDMEQPTLKEYVDSNPLLFVKDFWGRWVGLGEYDIQLPGGCGKPVVYLYPQVTTTVTINFLAPMQLTTDIPTYGDFWKVTANPDGTLVNLRPELTDCTKIDYSKAGSEYARHACETNTYPYLYWTGNVNSVNYPTINKGWVVERNNLAVFLNSKLDEIGFNANEKKDFTEYWLAEMLAKDAPYYRISFLQTDQLSQMFPMNVNPKPNTTFRMFMDWAILESKPTISLEPQVLNKIVRNGFTLVEWGGLEVR